MLRIALPLFSSLADGQVIADEAADSLLPAAGWCHTLHIDWCIISFDTCCQYWAAWYTAILIILPTMPHTHIHNRYWHITLLLRLLHFFFLMAAASFLFHCHDNSTVVFSLIIFITPFFEGWCRLLAFLRLDWWLQLITITASWCWWLGFAARYCRPADATILFSAASWLIRFLRRRPLRHIIDAIIAIATSHCHYPGWDADYTADTLPILIDIDIVIVYWFSSFRLRHFWYLRQPMARCWYAATH